MATTQLFAELLVIGFGVGIWLGILLAAILGYDFGQGIPKFDSSLVVVLGGPAYAMGIVVDRIARALLNRFERSFAQRLADPEEIERHILVSSEALAKQIHYNRSRLRICRSWALNLFLTLAAFLTWNIRVQAMQPDHCLLVSGILFFFGVFMAWTAWTLSTDYDKNLKNSYRDNRVRLETTDSDFCAMMPVPYQVFAMATSGHPKRRSEVLILPFRSQVSIRNNSIKSRII